MNLSIAVFLAAAAGQPVTEVVQRYPASEARQGVP